jgi:hypothetical protein
MPPIRHPNIRPFIQTRRAHIPHPSNGYGQPYPEDLRQLFMRIRLTVVCKQDDWKQVEDDVWASVSTFKVLEP